MQSALQTRVDKLYSRHAAAAERGGWSLVRDVRWGDIDVKLAQSQQDLMLAVRRITVGLSARGARAARLLHALSTDPHASAALTLELWELLKHLHALRTYLDAVDFAPRVSDAELAAARSAETSGAPPADAAGLLRLLFTQHLAATSLRHLGMRTAEPVLADLLALLAADEVRRAQVVGDLLALRIACGQISRDELRSETSRLREAAAAATQDCGIEADDLAVQTFVRRIELLCG